MDFNQSPKQLILNPLVVAIIGTLLLTFLTIIAFPPFFETNDDVGMNMIVSGGWGKSIPDEHLIFTNVMIGLPLAFCYSHLPTMPWYGMYQIATLLVASLGFAILFLRIDRTWNQVVLTLFHFSIVIAPCLTNIQFTKTAFLASEIGILFILGPILVIGPWTIYGTVFGFVLTLLGSLIRFESFLLAMFLLIPIGIASFILRTKENRRWPPYLLILMAGVLASAGFQFNKSYYAMSPGWENFYEFNALKAQLLDYSVVEYNQESKTVFDKVGWEFVDWVMFQSWFFADENKYKIEIFRKILAEAPHRQAFSGLPNPSFFPISMQGYRLWIAMLPCLFWANGWLPRLISILVFMVGILIAFLVSISFHHLPERVWLCLFYPPIATCALFSRGKLGSKSSVNLLQRAGIILASLLILWQISDWSLEWEQRSKINQIVNEKLNGLKSKSDPVIVVWGDSLPYENTVLPFTNPANLQSLNLIGLGWGFRTPITKAILEQLKINDLYQAIYQRAGLILVIKNQNYLNLFANYVFTHYGDRISSRFLVHEPELNLIFVQFSTVQPNQEKK